VAHVQAVAAVGILMKAAVAVLCVQAGLPQSAVVAAHGNFDSRWPAEQVFGWFSTPAWLLLLYCHVDLGAAWQIHPCGLHSTLCRVLHQGNPAVMCTALPDIAGSCCSHAC
jgi:uncharacterized membrane protein YecN with MAPEG domain